MSDPVRPSGAPAPGFIDTSGSPIPDNYVLAFDAPDFESGEIVCATLVGAGLHAVLANPELGPALNALPALGNTWSHGVFVAPGELDTALAVLGSSTSEEELAAEQAADPTTLEQAENSVRNA
ncbi:MAG TPA: hypothetical protein VKT77_04650 [Chthonomonadaceae bacterium]|nr:hypothetical protein [Chthonomonadaceae bacterium]